MPLPAKSLLTTLAFLVSLPMAAQPPNRPHDADLFARLSYSNTGYIPSEGVRHLCVALSRDGDYRLVRTLSGARIQRLEGKIPEQQFRQLRMWLRSEEFRQFSGNHGGLILKHAETFGAEIAAPDSEDGPLRLHWMNADGENPFPTPVAKVVDWLKHFEPKSGTSFGNAEDSDVCPSAGLRPIEPVVSELHH